MSVGKRYKVLPAVYLLFEQNNTILFLRRCGTGYKDGEYMFPAGHVEMGEGVFAAAVREAREEVGVDIREADMVFVHALHRSHENKDGEHDRIDMFFRIRAWSGSLRNAEPEKCDDMLFAPITSPPKDTTPYIRHVLACIGRGELCSVWEFPVV
jgi:8-oxo-dGTP diphosphatase